jgi:tetratricopeptide (TPR) repeat protein
LIPELLNIADALRTIGSKEMAEQVLSESLQLAVARKPGISPSDQEYLRTLRATTPDRLGEHSDAFRPLAGIAACCARMGSYDKALEILALARSVDDEKSVVQDIENSMRQGYLLRHLDNWRSSLSYVEHKVQIICAMATKHVASEQPEQASRMLDDALTAVQQIPPHATFVKQLDNIAGQLTGPEVKDNRGATERSDTRDRQDGKSGAQPMGVREVRALVAVVSKAERIYHETLASSLARVADGYGKLGMTEKFMQLQAAALDAASVSPYKNLHAVRDIVSKDAKFAGHAAPLGGGERTIKRMNPWPRWPSNMPKTRSVIWR